MHHSTLIVKFPKGTNWQEIDSFVEKIAQKDWCEAKYGLLTKCLNPQIDLIKEANKANAKTIERKNISFDNELDTILRDEVFHPSIEAVTGYLEYPVGAILVPGIAFNDRIIIITDKKLSQTKLPDFNTLKKDPRFIKIQSWFDSNIRSDKYYDLGTEILDQIKKDLNVTENLDLLKIS